MFYSCYTKANRIQFRFTRDEVNYLKQDAPLQTNRIIVTTLFNDLRFSLATSSTEGNAIYNPHPKYNYGDVLFISKTTWAALGMKFVPSGAIKLPLAQLIINNRPHLILSKSSINPIPIKIIKCKSKTNSLFHPEDHLPAPVKLISPSNSISELKTALALVKEAVKNTGAVLFLDENKELKAKIITII